MDELRMCPFCGGSDAKAFEADDIGGWLAGCCAQTWGDTEAEAIAAWNTRATPSAPVEQDELVKRLGELLDKTAFHSPSETRRGHYERLARAAISALRKTDHGRYVDQEIEK